MDNFKIKSIDEFDLDFVAKYNEKNDNEISSVSSTGPIPEIVKEENEENINNISYFNTADSNEQPFSPAPQDTSADTAQSEIIPQAYSPAGESPAYDNDDNSTETKQSGGVIAGKVISIIFLAATIIVFVLGCFVTIFIDNHGSDLFGLCFNTVSTDIYDSNDQEIFSKGDLIISKKADPSEYVVNEFIVVKSSSAGEEYYSDIHAITSVLYVSEESAEITTVNLAAPGIDVTPTSSEDTYGIVQWYLPALGTILHFAMDNAILTCVLFVLLAALWCLILVLIENKNNKAKQR